MIIFNISYLVHFSFTSTVPGAPSQVFEKDGIKTLLHQAKVSYHIFLVSPNTQANIYCHFSLVLSITPVNRRKIFLYAPKLALLLFLLSASSTATLIFQYQEFFPIQTRNKVHKNSNRRMNNTWFTKL